MTNKVTKEYSSASVSKHIPTKTWRASVRWREVAEGIEEDGTQTITKGKWHQLTKMTGVDCVLDPEGTPKDKRNNRGKQNAQKVANDWRESLIRKDKEAEENRIRLEREAVEAAIRAEEEARKAEERRIEEECLAEERKREEERLAAERAKLKTVADYADEIVSRKEGSVDKSTIKGYRYNAKQIREYFGDTLLTELTPNMVSDWKKALTSRYCPSTARKTFNFLKACTREAEEEELIERVPFTRSLKAPKLKQSKPNALNDSGRKLVIAKLKQSDSLVSVAAQIALYTGMRRGEICALTWNNINIERNAQGKPCGGEVTVVNAIGVAEGTYLKSTKTEKPRSIAIHSELAKTLAARKAAMKEEALSFGVPFSDSFYVLGNVNGEYLNPDVISREWAHFARYNGVPKGTQGTHITFHDLRHTFATAAFRAGAEVKAVSDILGHANAAMTLNVYTDSEDEAREEAVNAVGDSMQGGTAEAKRYQLKTGTEN